MPTGDFYEPVIGVTKYAPELVTPYPALRWLRAKVVNPTALAAATLQYFDVDRSEWCDVPTVKEEELEEGRTCKK